jgi:hypothetical protein
MGLDFGVIRVQLLRWRLWLKWRLQQLLWLAIDARIELLKRSIEKLEDKTLVAQT